MDRHCPRSTEGHDVVGAGPEVGQIVTHTRWLAIYLRAAAADTEHLLLGTFLYDKPESKVFRQLGVTFEDVYREMTGDEPPEEIRPSRPLYVPEDDLAPLLRFLPDVLPEGASYSFDFDDELAWFNCSLNDFEVYVRRALALADQ